MQLSINKPGYPIVAIPQYGFFLEMFCDLEKKNHFFQFFCVLVLTFTWFIWYYH